MFDFNIVMAASQDVTTIIDSVQEDDESISVHERDGLRWVYTGGASLLSAARVDALGELVFPTHHAMLCALLFCEQPARVLNLGFGVGSFERWFQANLPQAQIVSVDRSATLVALSREWFGIAAQHEVVIDTAANYLLATHEPFDIIVCDIFANGAHAPCLYDTDFYADVARCTASNGVLALNLSPESDGELLRILLAIRDTFATVWLTPVGEHGNVVVLASASAPPPADRLVRRASALHQGSGLALHHWLETFTALPPRPGAGAR